MADPIREASLKQLVKELLQEVTDSDDYLLKVDSVVSLVNRARAALANPDGPTVPESREPAAVAAEASPATPPTPAAGEVGELVAWLHGQDGGIGRRAIYSRIAALLEQQQERIAELEAEQMRLKPVPVGDPPKPEDCDAKGRCWFFDPCMDGWWWLRPALIIDSDPEPLTH